MFDFISNSIIFINKSQNSFNKDPHIAIIPTHIMIEQLSTS